MPPSASQTNMKKFTKALKFSSKRNRRRSSSNSVSSFRDSLGAKDLSNEFKDSLPPVEYRIERVALPHTVSQAQFDELKGAITQLGMIDDITDAIIIKACEKCQNDNNMAIEMILSGQFQNEIA